MRDGKTKLLYVVGSIVIVAAAAWSGGDEAQASSSVVDSRAPKTVVREANGDVALGSPTRGAAVSWLSDANIVALVDGMLSPAIAAGHLELQSANTDSAMNVALILVHEHTALRAAFDSLLAVDHLTGQRPAAGDSLLLPYQSQTTSLAGVSGKELGRRFVATQRDAHQQAIADLDALAALAHDPALKLFLITRAVQMEREHLARLNALTSVAESPPGRP